jgi:hypothetical protein
MAHPEPPRKPQRLIRFVIGLLDATVAARWSLTPDPPPAAQRREEAEADLVEAEVVARRFDTTERLVTLFWRSFFCCITAVLIGITIYCYLDGWHTTIPLVTVPFGMATGLASYLLGPRTKVDP